MEAPEAAALSEPEAVGLPELEAPDAVGEALPTDGVAAAEALGSESAPAVTTI